MLVRPRLLSILRSRWERPVTVVVAGAGFGKTTLLAQSVAENRISPVGIDAWVPCDPSHAAASVLATAVATALDAPRPQTTEVPALAAHLVDAVLALAPDEVALFLDDVHHVPEGSEGAALLGELLNRLPPTAHLVLGARRKPPVALARLLAHGDAIQLSEPDLAFTDEERASFAELRGVPLELIDGIGAWPAIGELVADAGHAVVKDYLWEEALAARPRDERRALAVLAGVGGADQAVFEIAMDGADVDLTRLVADVPLVTVGSDGWVELHALWKEPLAAEIEPDELRAARVRAALHLWERGHRHRAFDLLVRAEAWEELRRLVLEVCTHVYVPVATDVLDAWVRTLAAVGDHAEEPPEQLLLRAVLSAEQETGLPAAVELLTSAAEAFRERDDAVAELAALTHLFAFSYALGDEATLLTVLGRVFELEAGGHEAAQALGRLGRAGLADFMGDYAGALEALDAGTLTSADEEWAALRAWLRADLLEVTGHPEEALQAIEHLQDSGSDQLQDVLHAARTQALWAAGRVDEAVARREPILHTSPGAARRRAAQAADALVARYAAYLGDATVAARALASAKAAGPPADRIIEHRLSIGEAALAVLEGDEDAARRHLEAVLGEDPGVAALRSKMARRVLPLVYTLLPASRAALDAEPLGPSLAAWRSLARIVVESREGRADLSSLGTVSTGSVRAGLPLPWAVEVAVALEAEGRPEARELFAALGAPARAVVERLADGGTTAPAARRLLAEVPRVPAETVVVRFLGPAELQRGDELVDSPLWRRGRVRQLLAFLVIYGQTTREAVVDAFWPDLDPAAANNNLRSTLSNLLTVLTPERRSKEASYFVAQQGRVLAPTGTDRLVVDVWEAERLFDEAAAAERSGTPSLARVAYARALDLWRGPFLADTPAAWAEAEAERLRLRFVAAWVRAGELALAAGDPAEAGARATAAIEAEPWSENAYRLLAGAQLARGDRAAARHSLDRARAMLDDLGVEPESATRLLERRLGGEIGAGAG